MIPCQTLGSWCQSRTEAVKTGYSALPLFSGLLGKLNEKKLSKSTFKGIKQKGKEFCGYALRNIKEEIIKVFLKFRIVQLTFLKRLKEPISHQDIELIIR